MKFYFSNIYENSKNSKNKNSKKKTTNKNKSFCKLNK